MIKRWQFLLNGYLGITTLASGIKLVTWGYPYLILGLTAIFVSLLGITAQLRYWIVYKRIIKQKNRLLQRIQDQGLNLNPEDFEQVQLAMLRGWLSADEIMQIFHGYFGSTES